MGNCTKAAAAFCALMLSTGVAWAENHTSDFVEEDAKSAVVDTQVGSKGYVAPTPANLAAAHAPRGHLIIVHRSERRGPGPLYHVPGCPPGFNGMFRGTLYCINGRPLD